VELIYGTVRIIEGDHESFMPWANQPNACVILNLHTVHGPEGIQRSADAFRRLIDMAARHGGTYYLTYHRYADRKQQLTAPAAESLVPKTWQDRVVDSTGAVGQVLGEIENCSPQFAELLRLKKKYDPAL
jgi:hypothetical protein